jgi:hypothetical protein
MMIPRIIVPNTYDSSAWWIAARRDRPLGDRGVRDLEGHADRERDVREVRVVRWIVLAEAESADRRGVVEPRVPEREERMETLHASSTLTTAKDVSAMGSPEPV